MGVGFHLFSHAGLHECTPFLGRKDTCLDTGLGTSTLQDHICPVSQAEILDNFLSRGARGTYGIRGAVGFPRRHEDIVGAEGPRELGAGFRDVDAHDSLGAVGLGHGLAQDADGPTAKHENGLATPEPSNLTDLHRDGDRLHERPVLGGHVLRYLVAIVPGHDVVLLQSAVPGRSSREDGVGAEVVRASTTVITTTEVSQ